MGGGGCDPGGGGGGAGGVGGAWGGGCLAYQRLLLGYHGEDRGAANAHGRGKGSMKKTFRRWVNCS